MDKKRSSSLALRLLDWLIVGMVVLSSSIISLALSELLLRGLPFSTLQEPITHLTPLAGAVLLALLGIMSVLVGVLIEPSRPPLSIFAPGRFVQHILFGLVWGAALGLGIYGIFRRSYETDAHDLSWYLRDVYNLGISVYLYWLIYKVPERIQSLRRSRA